MPRVVTKMAASLPTFAGPVFNSIDCPFSILSTTRWSPQASSTWTGFSPTTATPGDFALTLTCMPQVRPEQRVALLFGNREISPEPFLVPGGTHEPTTLTFQIKEAESGTHFLRLRVDGVDSILVTYVGDPPKPVFDADQKVEVS